MKLTFNVLGSDIIKDDGVYAAYVLASDLKGNGRYNIKIQANGEGETKVITKGGGRSSRALDTGGEGTRIRTIDTSEYIDV